MRVRILDKPGGFQAVEWGIALSSENGTTQVIVDGGTGVVVSRPSVLVEPINKTGLKTLDKLAKDPRIDEIWSEGSDGYWGGLREGYNWNGCSCIHEWSVRDLMKVRHEIEVGDTY